MINKSDLSGFFLFKGLNEKEISDAAAYAAGDVISFSRGSIIYSPSLYERKIGYIVSGKCEVRRPHNDGAPVILNVLTAGDSFGVLAAFSDNEFPTEVYAVKNTEVIFFSKSDILSFIDKSKPASMNLIEFLTRRIEFLNEKIATFSGSSVEKKLASYILSESKEKGESFVFSRKKAAEAISAGRASVYRALDTFTELGAVAYDSKKIYIKDRTGLERISK